MDLIFRNATLVTDGLEMTADLAVRDGIVKAIGDLEGMSAKNVIDCTGKILLPGAVDLGLNLLDGGMYDPRGTSGFASATRDAALGGVTTVITTMESDDKGGIAGLIKSQGEADASKAFVDFGYHILVSAWTERHAGMAREAVAAGVPSFWITRTGSDSPQSAPTLLYAALQQLPDDALAITSTWDAALGESYARKASGDVADYSRRSLCPEDMESAIVDSLVRISSMGTCRVLLNGISSSNAVESLARVRETNSRIAAACHLSALVFTEADGDGETPRDWPPIAGKADQQSLYNALEEGILSAVVSAHKPRTIADVAAAKAQRQYWAGLPTLAHFLPSLHSEGVTKWRLSLSALSNVACADPAKLAGIYPRKGSLQIGSDADIVILDPTVECKVAQSESYAANTVPNPFESLKLSGSITDVYVRGQHAVSTGELTNNARGMFLPRKMSLR